MGTQNQQEFVFYSEKLNYKSQIGPKGKEYFVEGYISTGDMDLVNDIVTKSCMDNMMTQFDDRSIKLDFEHESFRGNSAIDAEANKTRIPLGKAIGKDRDAKGVKVKWQMNPTWKKFDAKGNVTMTFKDIWDNVESEMYDAFSIAYVPTKTTSMQQQGKSVRMLENVNILNVALTGNPINPMATMSAVMAKSLEFMKDNEILEDINNVEIKDFDEIDNAVAELKHKYIKRTGSSGKYNYTYPEDGKRSRSKPSGDEKPKERQGSSSKPKKEKTTKQAIVMSIDNDVSAQQMADEFTPDQLRQASESPMAKKPKITQARLIQEKKPSKKSEEQLFTRAVELNLSPGMADRFIKSNLSGEKADKNVGYTKMVDKKDDKVVPEAEAQPPEAPVEEGKEQPAEGEAPAEVPAEAPTEAPAEPEGKSMTLTEMKSIVETLTKDVDALKKQNSELKAIVEKPLQKSKGAENKEAKSQEGSADVKSFGGPMDLIA